MKYGTLIIIGMTALCLCGCSHTVQGVQQDAKDNTPVVQAAAQQADQNLQQASKSTDKVVSANLQKLGHDTKVAFLATQIKARVIANEQLNSAPNVVTVQQSSSAVILKGHVKTTEEKEQVSSIAKSAVEQDHASVVVNNELTVDPS